ncbi:MAG: DMT family transporter [Gammaproteobacteria bacterium]
MLDFQAITRSHRVPVFSLLAGATMWGLTWWPMRVLRDLGLSGAWLTILSSAAAALLLLPWALRQRQRWRPHHVALLVILLCGGYANLAYNAAMIGGNPLRVMMLFYLAPIWALLGAQVFLGERIDAARVAAVAIAVAGALLILGGPELLTNPPAVVDLLAISAGLTYAMNNLAYRSAESVPVVSKNLVMLVGAVMLAVPCLWLFPEPAEPSGGAWWACIAFGVLWLVPAVGLTQFGVAHMAAGRAAVLLTLELPVAAATGALFGGVDLTAMEWAGGLLILLAAIIDSRAHGSAAAEMH